MMDKNKIKCKRRLIDNINIFGNFIHNGTPVASHSGKKSHRLEQIYSHLRSKAQIRSLRTCLSCESAKINTNQSKTLHISFLFNLL